MKKLIPFGLLALCFAIIAMQKEKKGLAVELKGLTNEKRYDEISSIVAHNTYANTQAGWRYRQQNWSFFEQLDNGVRGFTMDVHIHGSSITLCHNKCRGVFSMQRGIFNSIKQRFGYNIYESFAGYLRTLNSWLDAHPTEIVTLFLKVNINFENFNDISLAKSSIKDKIFTQNDHAEEKWPTLKWMRNNNKRVVIFYEDKKDKSNKDYSHMFYAWRHVIESKYGITDPINLCYQRDESTKFNNLDRKLYMLNVFNHPTFEAKALDDNTFANLINAIHDCDATSNLEKNEKNLPQNKKPNFITLDFVDKGNWIELINSLNESKDFDVFITTNAQLLRKKETEEYKKEAGSWIWRLSSYIVQWFRTKKTE